MIVASIAVEEALLLLKILFLVLLYLFIWRIVRSAARDVRMPQESFVLAPGSVPGLGVQEVDFEAGKLVVVKSPALDEKEEWQLNSAPLTFGRSEQRCIAPHRDVPSRRRNERVAGGRGARRIGGERLGPRCRRR